MDRLFYEVPSIERKEDAIDYVNEHIKSGSYINGTGSLYNYLDDYEGWLDYLKTAESFERADGKVPDKTFFLVRESDNKIVGMINIRLRLNEYLRTTGIGNIGYGIRPTERGKGYNKINLYLGLLELQKEGEKEALLGCYQDNPASWKTMEALGGKLLKESVFRGKDEYIYTIDVDKSILKYKDIYEKLIKK